MICHIVYISKDSNEEKYDINCLAYSTLTCKLECEVDVIEIYNQDILILLVNAIDYYSVIRKVKQYLRKYNL